MPIPASLLLLAASVQSAPGIAPPPPPEPVTVMVLGTFHFANPGRDKVNVKTEDVTTPARQRELEALAAELARFRPTRVMVEEERPGPGFDVPAFRAFSPATLRTERGEDAQIGYRVAKRVGLASVQGIDEQPKGGEPDYFPADKLDAYAKAAGREADLAAVFAPIRAEAAEFERAQAATSIPVQLARYNDDRSSSAGQQIYYSMLKFGDGEAQPGADLNAMWYLRNVKVFSKLVNASRPGDRVLVVYGAGHGYWLRHFATVTPGFRLEPVIPYLNRAASALGRNAGPK